MVDIPILLPNHSQLFASEVSGISYAGGPPWGSSRLSVIRKLLEEEEIPRRNIFVYYVEGGRASTNKNYGSILERWLEFAREQGQRSSHPTLCGTPVPDEKAAEEEQVSSLEQ